MKAFFIRKDTPSGTGKPTVVDSKLSGRLAPALMISTLSLLGLGTLCTIGGALLLGLAGLPSNMASLAGQAVFAIAVFVGVITFIYCMCNG